MRPAGVSGTTTTLCMIVADSFTSPTMAPGPAVSPGLHVGTKCHFFSWGRGGILMPGSMNPPAIFLISSSGLWMPS